MSVPLRVERRPASRWHAEEATVYVESPDGPERVYEVKAYGPRSDFGRSQPAQVNWSALGAVSAELAESYAEAILRAAEIAPTLQPATETDAP